MSSFNFISNKISNFLRPIKKTKFISKINEKIEVLEKHDGSKVIYVRGAEQTGGTITGMWEKALIELQNKNLTLSNCLLLGLGGGDVVRILKKLFPHLRLTVVEIDPQMIKIAEIFFKIHISKNLKIRKMDAEFFLETYKQTFDLIIVDLFIGKFNPEKFRTPKFFKDIKDNLTSNGIIIYNSHFIPESPGEFEKFHLLSKNYFKNIEIIVSYRFSRILLLSN